MPGKKRAVGRGAGSPRPARWCSARVVYTYLTLPDVRPLATANPTTTAFMELRARESEREGKAFGFDQRWVPYSRISPNLRRAVLAAEDSAFWRARRASTSSRFA